MFPFQQVAGANDVFSRPQIDEVYRVEMLKSTFWHLLVHTIHSSQSFGDPFEALGKSSS